jgi:hypothetical protein
MRRRPPHIPQKRRIFLGCEGHGEHGYGTLLAHIAREARIHVHIDARRLQPGAGNPLALVEKVAQIIAQITNRALDLRIDMMCCGSNKGNGTGAGHERKDADEF